MGSTEYKTSVPVRASTLNIIIIVVVVVAVAAVAVAAAAVAAAANCCLHRMGMQQSL